MPLHQVTRRIGRLGSWFLHGWLVLVFVLSAAPCCEGVTGSLGTSVAARGHADDVRAYDHGILPFVPHLGCGQSLDSAPFVPSATFLPTVDASAAFVSASEPLSVVIEDATAPFGSLGSAHGPPRRIPPYLLYTRLLL